MVSLVCEQCKKQFERKEYNLKRSIKFFCSPQCYYKFRKTGPSLEELICLFCKKRFTARICKKGKFCSPSCFYKSRKKPCINICQFCKMPFKTKHPKQKFHNHLCYSLNNKNKKYSGLTPKERAQESKMIAKYGIKPLEWRFLLFQQKGKCPICFTEILDHPDHTNATDHNHKTGKIRGILCSHCNKGLGFFKDSPELLLKAAQYLQYDS